MSKHFQPGCVAYEPVKPTHPLQHCLQTAADLEGKVLRRKVLCSEEMRFRDVDWSPSLLQCVYMLDLDT